MHRLPSYKWPIFYLLLCSLWLNSFLPHFTAAAALEKANGFDNGDAVLVCTGKQFTWFSSSIFEQTGKLVAVDPPSKNNVIPDTHLCPLGLAADHQQHYIALDLPGSLANLPIAYESDQLAFLVVKQNHYVHPPGRAPPVNFPV
jgi:hypothetical protein